MDKLNNNKIILPCHFFGSVELYALQVQHPSYWESMENYQKRSCRNRFTIKGPNGAQNFSLPLKKGKNEQMPIREVRISYDENWIKIFREMLVTAYKSSPYFEYYYPDIKQELEKDHDFLWDLNWSLSEIIQNWIDADQTLSQTKEWIRDYSLPIHDFRYVKSIVTESYQYPQVPHGTDQFVRGLSILDLLFCQGPETKFILNNINIHYPDVTCESN